MDLKRYFSLILLLILPFQLLAEQDLKTESPLGTLCFQEDFSSITAGNSTSTSGSSSPWPGNTNFPITQIAYQAGGAVRIGNSSDPGFITSRPLTGISGNLRVELDVKGWANLEGHLILTLGTKSKAVLYSALISNSFETVFVNFPDIPDGSNLTIATSDKRAFIDEVRIYCDGFEGSPTDYFRSKTSGEWMDLSTWETSATGEDSTWEDALLIPDQDAAGIIISPAHTVQISTHSVIMTATEVYGTLEITAPYPYLILGDDPYELRIKENGIFLVNSVGSEYEFQGNGLVESGGRIIAGPGMNGGTAFANAYVGFNSGLFSFEDQAICQWDNGTTVMGSITPLDANFFRPTTSDAIPIFQITTTPKFPFGSNISNIFFCTLEVVSPASFSFTFEGQKTIAYGIQGSGAIFQMEDSGNIRIGLGDNLPILDGSVQIHIQDNRLKIPNGLVVPTAAHVQIRHLDDIQNSIIDLENGTLEIQGTLDIHNLRIQNSGNIVVENFGKIKTRNTGGLYGHNSAIIDFESDKLELKPLSFVEYYAELPQWISCGLDAGYGHLILSGNSTKTPNGKNLLVQEITEIHSGELNIPSTTDTEFPYVLNAQKGIHNLGGNLIFENNSVLLQNADANNLGFIHVKRNAVVPSIQYNFWASPVKDQLLYEIYPDIPNNRVMVYNSLTDYYDILPTNTHPKSEFAKGYSIKGSATEAPDVTAHFIGTPQNESLIVEENRINLSTLGENYNLIGNPFPSNLDLDLLYLANESAFYNELDETPTFYFWDNTDNDDLIQQGSTYVNQNFAIYNPNFQTGIPAPRLGETGKTPNGIVKPGQGFIIRASESATYLEFSNTMRTADIEKNSTYAPYFKGNLRERNTFKLKLITPENIHTILSIGYFDEAENTLEKFDSFLPNESASINFYSLSEEGKKLAIQGRKAPFETTHKIPIGIKTNVDGWHEIKIEKLEGIFEHQNLYVLDKLTGMTYSLQEEICRIELRKGEYPNRFQILFKIRPKLLPDSDLIAKN